jgi:hypothetical protein
MSDEPQGPITPDVGQAAPAPWSQGQIDAAPDPQGGQAQVQPDSQDAGQAPMGTQPTDEPSFFDPQQVPIELLPAYKQMQAAFTTKTQDISRQKQKVEAYDAFMRDPVGQMQALARQYGLNLTRAEAAAEVQAQQAQQTQNWEPQTWQEVIERTKQETRQEIMRELQPIFGQVQQQQANNIENQLKQIDPNWKDYEGNMRDLLNEHPTLVKNVSMLYRLAVPPEALEATAIQKALKKYEDKGKHAAVSSGSSAPRSKPAAPKINSFDEAYQEARRKLLSGEV